VKRLALCFLLLTVAATPALAANWTQVPGVWSGDLAYVDIASVRQDTYPKRATYASGNKTYLVAWLATKDQNGNFTAQLEVASLACQN
jgi:hypothetical protein